MKEQIILKLSDGKDIVIKVVSSYILPTSSKEFLLYLVNNETQNDLTILSVSEVMTSNNIFTLQKTTDEDWITIKTIIKNELSGISPTLYKTELPDIVTTNDLENSRRKIGVPATAIDTLKNKYIKYLNEFNIKQTPIVEEVIVPETTQAVPPTPVDNQPVTSPEPLPKEEPAINITNEPIIPSTTDTSFVPPINAPANFNEFIKSLRQRLDVMEDVIYQTREELDKIEENIK